MNPQSVGRFTDVSYLVLASLSGGPKHGYAMMEDIREFSGRDLEPGTLYGAISRLEEQGWIEAMPAEDRRRPYRVTAEGVAALNEKVTTLEKVAGVGRNRLNGLEGSPCAGF